MWIHDASNHKAYPPASIAPSTRLQKRQRRRSGNHNQQMWTRVFQPWQHSVLLHSSPLYSMKGRVFFLASEGKQKSCRNEWGIWSDSNWAGYCSVICIIRKRRTLIRENVTVDSHFSGNWLDTKLSQWASRAHENSSDDDEERGEARPGQAGEHCYPVLISQREQIKACWIFNNQKESFWSIYYILWSRKAAHHEFYVFLYVFFIFLKSSCPQGNYSPQ